MIDRPIKRGHLSIVYQAHDQAFSRDNMSLMCALTRNEKDIGLIGLDLVDNVDSRV